MLFSCCRNSILIFSSVESLHLGLNRQLLVLSVNKMVHFHIQPPRDPYKGTSSHFKEKKIFSYCMCSVLYKMPESLCHGYMEEKTALNIGDVNNMEQLEHIFYQACLISKNDHLIFNTTASFLVIISW